MDITVNFYIQAVLCIITFVAVFFLMQSTEKLKKELDKKADRD
ncbi:MAG: hypothetical protein ACR2NW_02855 [Thermodesulfobacteriota bacterium]